MPNLDPFDAVQDARSESRYEDDPREEPDLSEVKDALARMGYENVERPERLYGRA